MPRTRSSTKNHENQPPAEAAGRAFQRLHAALVAELSTRDMESVAQERAEVARQEAQLAEARQRLARAEQAVEGSQRQCSQLRQELEELRPRLGYNFELPQDTSLAIISRLGTARCRAAMACRGLRAAVGSADRLGAFRHRVLAVCANGYHNGFDEDGQEEYAGHTVVCTGDAVFSFGAGGPGQLGYLASKQTAPRMVTGLLGQEVVVAAASARSTLLCTAEGQAYWFGQLHGEGGTSVPQLVPGLQQVVGVAAGMDHLLAWTRTGELYTWGRGEYGQLGHGNEEDEAAPRLAEGLVGQQVVGADGGETHSVVYTANGQVYTFGYGRAELGHGPDAGDYQLTPKVVEGLAGSTVVAVAAGNGSTAAVTETGELYTWGCFGFDLGHGQGEENTTVSQPRLVAGLAGQKTAGVTAGAAHTLAWTDSGELYSWGYGCNGELGHGTTENEHLPRRVEALAGKVVVGAAGGYAHSAVVTRAQEVYTFGSDHSGQLGHSATHEDSVCLVPKEAKGLTVSSLKERIAHGLRVPQDYPTVRAAVDAARPGERVVLAAGLYKENLVITKQVEIVGAAGGRAVLEYEGDNNVIEVGSGGALTLRNLTVRHGGGLTDGNAYGALTVSKGGSAQAEGCDFSSAAGGGVYCQGEGSELRLKDCTMHDCLENGVHASLNGKALAEGCTVRDNGAHGIGVQSGASAELRNNTCTANTRYGIAIVQDEGQGPVSAVMEGNRLEGNTRGAMYISERCRARVQHSGNTGNLLHE